MQRWTEADAKLVYTENLWSWDVLKVWHRPKICYLKFLLFRQKPAPAGKYKKLRARHSDIIPDVFLLSICKYEFLMSNTSHMFLSLFSSIPPSFTLPQAIKFNLVSMSKAVTEHFIFYTHIGIVLAMYKSATFQCKQVLLSERAFWVWVNSLSGEKERPHSG